MITRVEIENFKAIEKLSMDFTSRLTVIVGPNGSGKTSILQAANSFGKASRTANATLFRRIGATVSPWVKIVTPLGGVEFNADNSESPRERSFLGDATAADIPGTVLLHCDFDQMSQPSMHGSSLQSDASNLSAVLAGLKLNDPEKFSLIEETLCRIIPQIVRIRFDQVPMRGLQLVSTESSRSGYQEMPTGPSLASGFRLLFDTALVAGIPADSASEGTLLSLGIITAIVMRDSEFENVVLVDDLDASLHPSAQKSLIEAIRKLLEMRPKLQVIATSHSPYLLDSLTHDEIRLTTLDDQGRVVCGTLMDHPDFERWKDEMTPGEMWSMFGEKWLTAPKESVPVIEVAT